MKLTYEELRQLVSLAGQERFCPTASMLMEKEQCPELIAHLKKLNAFIKQYETTNKSNSTTLQTIDEKTQEFLAHLTERHPNLTQGEKHLASLLRVNLSTKEIAMLTGNTAKTINMNRYRLRKSLGLSGETDLVEYIQSI